MLSDDAYLTLDGENVVVKRGNEETGRFPLHALEGIIAFNYSGASPSLMAACAERKIGLSFCSPSGHFLARVNGMPSGNVLLRREQYRIADDPERSLQIAKNMIIGKLYNSRWCLERTIRDHELRVDCSLLRNAADYIKNSLSKATEAKTTDDLRGIEGKAAEMYFSVFSEMILVNKGDFYFTSRNRRPPTDNINAMLSFAYTLLAHECASALESVGFDSYVGFFHTDRPGRASLSLDLMEELRPVMADRFIISMINDRMIQPDGFIKRENGSVIMREETKKKFVANWHNRNRTELHHPYTGEKMQWGLIPFIQALLLSRMLRKDITEYPPFFWK